MKELIEELVFEKGVEATCDYIARVARKDKKEGIALAGELFRQLGTKFNTGESYYYLSKLLFEEIV